MKTYGLRYLQHCNARFVGHLRGFDSNLSHKAQIHVDGYKHKLYKSLAFRQDDMSPCHDGTALAGFPFANRFQEGCLTDRPEVRLHSCEYGTDCPVLTSDETVFITPILGRDSDGTLITEIGAGGGGKDLVHDFGLELYDDDTIRNFVDVCEKTISNANTRAFALEYFFQLLESQDHIIQLRALGLDIDSDGVDLKVVAQHLVDIAGKGNKDHDPLLLALEGMRERHSVDCKPQHELSRRLVCYQICSCWRSVLVG